MNNIKNIEQKIALLGRAANVVHEYKMKFQGNYQSLSYNKWKDINFLYDEYSFNSLEILAIITFGKITIPEKLIPKRYLICVNNDSIIPEENFELYYFVNSKEELIEEIKKETGVHIWIDCYDLDAKDYCDPILFETITNINVSFQEGE